MSSAIDEKVVSIKFNHNGFEEGVESTLKSIDKLNNSVKLDGLTKSLGNTKIAIEGINFDNIDNGVTKLTNRFSLLGTVVGRFAERISDDIYDGIKGGINKLYSATFGQIKSGGISRAMNLEQANFQLMGLLKDAKAVKDVMADVSYAVDGTAYGLDEAAVVASQLAASNVKAGEEMKAALRGISGTAAMTGKSYAQIGQTFTRVAGQGRVMATDLNSLAAAGINAAATLGDALGKSEAEIREMVSKGQIDFKTFSNAMNDAFGEHATAANETFTGSLSNVKSALSRIGAKVATPGLTYLRDIFNELRPQINTVNAALDTFFNALNRTMDRGSKWVQNFIKSWDFSKLEQFGKMGGWSKIILTVEQAVKNLYSIVKPIGQAFKDAFSIDVASINVFLQNLKNMVYRFKMSDENAKNLHDTFKGLFDVIKFGLDIVKSFLSIFIRTDKESKGILGTIVSITGAIGRVLSYITWLIDKLGILKTLTTGLKIGVQFIIGLVMNLIGGVLKLIAAISKTQTVSKLVSVLGQAFAFVAQTVQPVIGLIGAGILKLIDGLKSIKSMGIDGVVNTIDNALMNIPETLDNIKNKIKDTFSRFSFDSFKMGVDRFRMYLNNVGVGGGLFGTKVYAASLGGEEMEQATEKANIFVRAIEKIKSTFDSIKTNIGNVFRGISNDGSSSSKTIGDHIPLIERLTSAATKFFSVVTPGKILAIVSAIAAFKVASGVMKLLQSFAKFADKAAGAIDNVTSCFNNIGTAIKNLSKTRFKDVAYPIAALVASFAALAFVTKDIDINKLWQLAAIVSVMSVVMGVIAALMTKVSASASKGGGKFNFSGLNLQMVSLAAGMLIMIKAYKEINTNDLTNMWSKLLLMGTLMVAMGTVCTIMGKVMGGTRVALRTSIFMIAFAYSLKMMFDALHVLETVNWDSIKDNMLELGEFLVAVGAAAALGGKFGIGSAIALVIVMKSLNSMYDAVMEVINKPGISTIAQKIEAHKDLIHELGSFMVAIMAVNSISTFGKHRASNLGMSLLGIALAFNLMIPFIKACTNISEAEVKKATDIMKPIGIFFAGLMVVAGIANRIGGKKGSGGLVKAGASMLLFATSMLIIYQAMKLMGNLDQDVFDQGLWAISSIMALFTALVMASGFSGKAKIGPLVALVTSLSVLFIEMTVLTLIPFDDLYKAAGAMSMVMVAFGAAIYMMGNVKVKATTVLATIALMITVIASFAGLIFAAKAMDADLNSLASVGAGMAAVVLSLGLAMKAIGSLASNKATIMPTGLLSSMTAFIVALVPALLALGVLSKLNADWKSMLSSAAGIGIVMVALGESIKIMGSIKNISMPVALPKTLQSMALCILAIGGALALASRYDWKGIAASSAGISATLIALGVAMKIIGTIPKMDASITKPLIVMALDIVAIGGALALAARYPWEQIAVAAGSISVVLLAMAGVMKIISTIKEIKVTALIAMAIAIGQIVAIGTALNMISGYDWGSLLAAAGGISMVLIAIAGSFAIISKVGGSDLIGSIAAIGTLITGIFLIRSIGEAMASIVDQPWLSMIAAAGAIDIVLVGLAGTFAIMSALGTNIIGAVAAIGAMVAGVFLIRSIGDALAGIAQFPGSQAIAAAGAIAIVIGVLTAAGAVAGFLPPVAIGMIAVAGACALLGVGVQSAGAGCEMFAAAVQSLNTVWNAFAMQFPMNCTMIVMGITTLGMGWQQMVVIIGDGMLMIVQYVGQGMTDMAEAINTGGVAVIDAIANVVDEIIKKVAELPGKLLQAGKDAIAGLGVGLGGGEGAGQSLGSKVISGFKKVTGWGSPWTTMIQAGKDAVQGLMNGSSIADVAGSIMGNNFVAGAYNNISSGMGDVGNMVSGALNDMGLDVSEFSYDSWLKLDKVGKKADDVSAKIQRAAAGSGTSMYGSKINEYLSGTSKTADKAKKSMDSLATSTSNYGKAASGAASGAKSLADTISSQMDIFSEWSQGEEISADQMLHNMQSQIDGVSGWANDMAVLATRGIDQGLLAKLQEMGPQGAAKVKAFASMTNEQLLQANMLWQQSLALPQAAASMVQSSGVKVAKGLVTGYTNNLDVAAVTQASTTMATEGIIAPIEEITEVHSPSKFTIRIAEGLLEGLNDTLDKGKKGVESSAKAIGEAATKGIKESLDSEKWNTIGLNAAKGLIAGLQSKLKDVQNAAKQLASTAESSTKKTLKEKSPSKVFEEIGAYAGEGMVNGFTAWNTRVGNAAAGLGDSAIDSIVSPIQQINDLTSDLLNDPIITPILDLSNVYQQAGMLGSLFDSQRLAMAGAGGGYDPVAGRRVNSSASTYNITINAPTGNARDIAREVERVLVRR